MKRRRVGIESERASGAFLFYWKDYVSDTRKHERTHHFEWYSHSIHRVLEKLRIGDRVWAIARIERDKYALVAKFVISDFWQKRTNPKKNEWTHVFEGSKTKSQFFEPEESKKFEYLVRELSFLPKAEHLGMSFRGKNCLHRLTPKDNEAFINHARTLSFLSHRLRSIREKSRLIGEKERKAINKGPPEWREVFREIAKRDSNLVKLLKKDLDGRCQLCGRKPFGGKFGEIAQAHHIKWLSDGGHDAKENMILLCPNHHAAVHAVGATFDRERLQFDLAGHPVTLKLSGHFRKFQKKPRKNRNKSRSTAAP